MSLVIRLRDNFEWEAYEKAVQKILNCKHPIVVTWDLRDLTKIPWGHVSKTLGLLMKIESLDQEHIIKSIYGELKIKDFDNDMFIGVFR